MRNIRDYSKEAIIERIDAGFFNKGFVTKCEYEMEEEYDTKIITYDFMIRPYAQIAPFFVAFTVSFPFLAATKDLESRF